MTEAFENIELYNLFCGMYNCTTINNYKNRTQWEFFSDLLNVTPAPNNGTYAGLGDLLAESNFKNNTEIFAQPQICKQQSKLQVKW